VHHSAGGVRHIRCVKHGVIKTPFMHNIAFDPIANAAGTNDIHKARVSGVKSLSPMSESLE